MTFDFPGLFANNALEVKGTELQAHSALQFVHYKLDAPLVARLGDFPLVDLRLLAKQCCKFQPIRSIESTCKELNHITAFTGGPSLYNFPIGSQELYMIWAPRVTEFPVISMTIFIVSREGFDLQGWKWHNANVSQPQKMEQKRLRIWCLGCCSVHILICIQTKGHGCNALRGSVRVTMCHLFDPQTVECFAVFDPNILNNTKCT